MPPKKGSATSTKRRRDEEAVVSSPSTAPRQQSPEEQANEANQAGELRGVSGASQAGGRDGNQTDAPPKDRALRHDRQNFANNPSVREHYLRVYPWAEYCTSEHERWEAIMETCKMHTVAQALHNDTAILGMNG
eukprot:PhM_4_TR13973/c4_g2_i3/m.36071